MKGTYAFLHAYECDFLHEIFFWYVCDICEPSKPFSAHSLFLTIYYPQTTKQRQEFQWVDVLGNVFLFHWHEKWISDVYRVGQIGWCISVIRFWTVPLRSFCITGQWVKTFIQKKKSLIWSGNMMPYLWRKLITSSNNFNSKPLPELPSLFLKKAEEVFTPSHSLEFYLWIAVRMNAYKGPSPSVVILVSWAIVFWFLYQLVINKPTQTSSVAVKHHALCLVKFPSSPLSF